MDRRDYVLTLSCPDRRGIVAAVAGVLAEHGCNITESQQFGDAHTGRFFLRVQFAIEHGHSDTALRWAFAALATDFGLEWQIRWMGERPRLLVLVSTLGHCLNDLLFRQSSGLLDVDIAAVAGNHTTLEPLARSHDVDFHHVSVTPDTKRQAEEQILGLVESYNVDLVVLARYMQILSEDLCAKLQGRVINIHHSFLPSFKGARPYHQAHARGVKLIGATAHYVTPDLDEGPIIEQEIQRVDHAYSPEELAGVGRDLESAALARAVRWHAERRVLLNGSKTVVFS